MALPTAVPSLTVLVADDNVDNAQTLAKILTILDPGLRTLEAYDGQQAIEVARTHPPDLAFVDLNMPGLDGHEVADEIRRIRGEQVPCIVCITGRWLEKQEVRTITSDGFDVVLFKPLELTDIEAVLNRCRASSPKRGTVSATVPRSVTG